MVPLNKLLPILLLGYSFASIAAEEKPDRWYQVELILFQPPQPVVETSEQWDGWRKKSEPINYDESVEITYPTTAKDLSANKPSEQQYSNSSGIISLKQAEKIVAEDLMRAANTVSSQTSLIELQPFTFIPNPEWTLGEVYEKLNSSNQYQLLLHTAWLQPGLSREQAVAVHIHNQMMLINEQSSAEDLDTQNEGGDKLSVTETASQATGATSYPLQSSLFDQGYSGVPSSSIHEQPVPELSEITLNGTVKVILSRYLHFEVNMEHAPSGFPKEPGQSNSEMRDNQRADALFSENPLTSFVGDEAGDKPLLYETSNLNELLTENESVKQIVYRLKDSRRMRSRELHYIDHPKLGILVKIIPVVIPQKEA